MMWFTADLHLDDTNILHDMDRPFDSVEEMNRKVIDAINECVAADDRLYILSGDEPLPHAQLERQGTWRHYAAWAYPQQG